MTNVSPTKLYLLGTAEKRCDDKEHLKESDQDLSGGIRNLDKAN